MPTHMDGLTRQAKALLKDFENRTAALCTTFNSLATMPSVAMSSKGSRKENSHKDYSIY